MSPNENNIAPAPKTVWEYLDRDKSSPLWRIYRLQSMLCSLSLSLGSDRLDSGSHLDHIRAFAEHAFSECEDIGGEMEHWLDKIKYLPPLKH